MNFHPDNIISKIFTFDVCLTLVNLAFINLSNYSNLPSYVSPALTSITSSNHSFKYTTSEPLAVNNRLKGN